MRINHKHRLLKMTIGRDFPFPSHPSLLPARRSTYRRHHSTETAVLIVHNDIVRAVDRVLVRLYKRKKGFL